MSLKCSLVSPTHFALQTCPEHALFRMWKQDMWVGPNQHPIEPLNIPIFFFLTVDLVLLCEGISFPSFSTAIKAPPSAQELFALRRPY